MTLNPPAGLDQAAIREARESQNQAIAAQRWNDVAGFWTQDVVVVTGLGGTLQGRAAYRAAFAADPGTVFRRIPSVIEVSAHWLLAWEEGTWTGHRGADTAQPEISGRYSAQWVKLRGTWLIRSELFVALQGSAEARRFQVAPPAR